MNTILPPDVAAYLQQAAIKLATEQGFQPDSESALCEWMETNCREIGERAMGEMHRLRDMLLAREDIRDAACEALSERVYNLIPKRTTKLWNPRFVRYAASRNMTPDEALAADGNMSNYLCWKEVA